MNGVHSYRMSVNTLGPSPYGMGDFTLPKKENKKQHKTER